MTKKEHEAGAAERFEQELVTMLENTYHVRGIELLPAERQSIHVVADLLTSKADESAFRALRISRLQAPMVQQVRSNTKGDFSPVGDEENGIRPPVLIATYLLAKMRELRYQHAKDEGLPLSREQQRYLGVAPQVLDTLDQVIGKSQIEPATPLHPESEIGEIHDHFHTAFNYLLMQCEDLPDHVNSLHLIPHAMTPEKDEIIRHYGGAPKHGID